jgi:hypothetical protein
MSGGLNLDPLFYSAGVSLAVVVVGTPVAWRALAATPRVARVLASNLACLGVAGLVALLLTFTSYRLDEMVMTTVLFSAVLQGAAAVILSLLPRRA